MGWFSRKKKKKYKRWVKKAGKKVFKKTPYGRAYTAGKWAYRGGRALYRTTQKRTPSYRGHMRTRHNVYGKRRDEIIDRAQKKYKSRGRRYSPNKRRYRRYHRPRGNYRRRRYRRWY